jgi:hypothetical protein
MKSEKHLDLPRYQLGGSHPIASSRGKRYNQLARDQPDILGQVAREKHRENNA